MNIEKKTVLITGAVWRRERIMPSSSSPRSFDVAAVAGTRRLGNGSTRHDPGPGITTPIPMSAYEPMLMQMAAKAGESVYVDDGSLRTSAVHVDDAATLYLLAASKAKAGDIFNGNGSIVTLREMAEAIGAALQVRVRSVSREEAEAIWSQFLTAFVLFGNRPSNRNAIQQLGWQPKGIDLLTDIRSGSYRELAEKLRRAQSADYVG